MAHSAFKRGLNYGGDGGGTTFTMKLPATVDDTLGTPVQT